MRTMSTADSFFNIDGGNEPDDEAASPVTDGTSPTDHNDVPQPNTNARPKRLHRYCGVVFGILSALLYALQSLCLKVSTETVNPALLVAVNSPVMLVGSLLHLIYNGTPLPRKREHFTWLLLTSLAVSANSLMFSYALSYADLGDVVTIVYTSLIIVAILARFMLGETFGLFGLLMTVTTLAGVVFVSRPPFIFGTKHKGSDYHSSLIGMGLALGAAVTLSFIITSMRNHAILRINPFLTMLFNSLLLIVTSVTFCTVTWSWHCLSYGEWLSSLAAGVCYFGGQILCLYALKYEKTLTVNIMLTLEIPVVFLFQLLILKIPPPWTSYFGSALIVSACIGITVKRDKKKTDTN